MGIVLSSSSMRERDADIVTISESETMADTNVLFDDDNRENTNADNVNNSNGDDARIKAKEEEMVEFKKQLNIKREQRREILARHRAEKEELEKSLQNERVSKLELSEHNRLLKELLIKHNIEIPENLQSPNRNNEMAGLIINMREEFETLKSNNIKLRRDLADTNRALQEANSDIADLISQNSESMKHINALKEVVTVSKTMINLREQQLNDLRNKLNEIERTLADRETNLLSTDLRQEYERQLLNIRTLRGLYEERARLAEVTRQGLIRELDEHKIIYQAEANKSKELAARIEELESKVEALLEIIESKNNQISSCQEETNALKAEMAVVNKLFSQVLLGYKTKQDLDKLVHRLEENHGLLTQMAERENGSEASSALPKLLLELVSQVEENEEKDNISDTDNVPLTSNKSIEELKKIENTAITTAEEIVENLPKVWKVLIELLSHQNVTEEISSEKVTTCYKSVETKSGPVLVPSVSQTYIRLKDLIVEKLGLIKEVNRMKQLNTHLETRLEEQERRLCLVTNELSKTWHVVGRLRRHHHQLHTHEKILKYELQQKRKLLNELKEELEYCREKWEQAREKNNQSEKDWKKLRAEFSSRKIKSDSPLFNNSAESGYSDERPSDESSESNDESEYVREPLLRSKKKVIKSFEIALDSSTDFNLAAEREDPASDMLDVAELPLDIQENEVNQNTLSEPIDNPKSSEETEDEICDITHDDLCTKEAHPDQVCTLGQCDKSEIEDGNNSISIEHSPTPLTLPLINPAEILRNVKHQTEMLSKKDEKLKTLENNSAALLRKTQTTNKLCEQINNTLDHIINRPTTSFNETNIGKEGMHQSECVISKEEYTSQLGENKLPEKIENNPKQDFNNEVTKIPNTLTEIAQAQIQRNINKISSNEPNSMPDSEASLNFLKNTIQVEMPDFKSILENVRTQNETVAKKDERLYKLERACSGVVQNITTTLKTGDKLIEKLNAIHEQQNNTNESIVVRESNEPNQIDQEDAVPSTSSATCHEARFAARDLRLKRLEEQTKSLVNKVNKTTSKGVKIHYKLEELHNIYGSENSRAGTPSEDIEDNSDVSNPE